MFWVISVYFNVRNTLEVLSILPGTPCIYLGMYVYMYVCVYGVLVRRHEGKRPVEKPRRRWNDKN